MNNTSQLIKDMRSRRQADALRREQAEANPKKSIILTPDEVAGDYDMMLRRLVTTIDGKPRPITVDDLRTFKAKTSALKGKLTKAGFKGGISPALAISMSLRDDIERANKQIKTASPLRQTNDGLIVFKTNSSAGSKVSGHYVSVRFMAFTAAVAAAQRFNGKTLAASVIGGRIRFDCDCERHTYWYRYIATVGGFNEGRNETGFPKIRNPHLRGICCKHALRVMTTITKSAGFKGYMANWIDFYRKSVTKTHVDTTAKERATIERLQSAETKKQRDVSAPVAAKAAKARWAAAKPEELAKELKKQSKTPTGQKIIAQAKRGLDAALQVGAITETQYKNAMKAINAK